jgi:hypothetical protein
VEGFEEGTLITAAAIVKVLFARTGVRIQWMHDILKPFGNNLKKFLQWFVIFLSLHQKTNQDFTGCQNIFCAWINVQVTTALLGFVNYFPVMPYVCQGRDYLYANSILIH